MTAARREKDPPSDAELLAGVAAGDVEWLGALFDRHAASLHVFVRRVAPREDADDVVQDTFLRVTRVAASYDARGASARAWLFGVAFSIVRERRRAFARLRRVLASLLRETPSRAVTAAGSTRTEVEQALESLSPARRDVVVLTEVMGMSAPEAARVLGISAGAVWTRLHEARRELRKHAGATDV